MQTEHLEAFSGLFLNMFAGGRTFAQTGSKSNGRGILLKTGKEVGARRDEVGEHKVLDSEGSLLHRVICSKFLGTARARAGWRWGLGWDPDWKADSEPLWFC